MNYEGGDTVAANTTENTAQEIRINIAVGVIVEWDIGAFDEAADLLHIKILHADHQLIPFNRDMSLRPGLVDKPFTDHYEITEPPYQLRVKAWNTDDSYQHEYWVRVNMLPLRIAGTTVVSPNLFERIKSAFGIGE